MGEYVAPANDGILARVGRAELDIQRLVDGKADKDDVQRLAEEFKSLRHTLQWFMGIVATAVIAFFGLIIALIQGAS